MEKFQYIAKDKISQLPKTSGVYSFLARRSPRLAGASSEAQVGESGKKGTKLLYIGKAANIKERVKNHFLRPAYRDNLFINQVSKVGYIKTDSIIEALILEANLIKKYQPKYNVAWRDDKNYFFIGATKEDFPRIFITHQPKNLKSKILNLKSVYIGPFVDGSTLKQALKTLRKAFPYRSCKTLPNRPCFWYHLNRCPAPCLLKSGLIKEIPPDFLKLKKVSQRNARNLMKTLKEGENKVLKGLKREMKLASKNQYFETAGKIRDQISALEKVVSHSKIFESKVEILSWLEIQEKLKEILKTKNKISKIEAYDVSNIQGQTATGSMVTFISGLPDKNFYRKFKIKVAGKPNDIAMLRECLNRRFKHKEWPYPDLILIDGGRAQLNAARQCSRSYLKQVKVIALAKRKNELFIEEQKKPILLKKLPREIFNLILQLRDEAHRFAKKYHLKLREVDIFD